VLKEVENSGQVPGEPRRRWFQDTDSDLIVWEDDACAISGFQLCCGKSRDEHALTWRQGTGFVHGRVDDGEGRPFHYKSTPVLAPDGHFDVTAAAADFRKRSMEIDPNIAMFILERLSEYGEQGPGL
jgi:hypothetical protein